MIRLLIAVALVFGIAVVFSMQFMHPQGPSSGEWEGTSYILPPSPSIELHSEFVPAIREVAYLTDGQAVQVPARSSSRVEPEDLNGIEDETDQNRVNWRVLRYSLHEYQAKQNKDPRGTREAALICRSVATMLQLSGRGGDPDYSASPGPGEHYIISNGRGYRWARGEFPEYDAWYDHGFAVVRFEEAMSRNPNAQLERPVFDEDNFALVEARAIEAIKALESTYGFH